MFWTLVSIALIATGLLFFLGASIGLVRFPDFYTRMHAAGKGDTLSTLMIITGVAIYYLSQDFSWLKVLVALKIMSVGVFVGMTSPTSTHALMQAGYEDGIEPFLAKEEDNEETEEEEAS